MAAAGHASNLNNSFYDQPNYVGGTSSAPLVNNGRESGFYKSGQVNHDDPPFSRYIIFSSLVIASLTTKIILSQVAPKMFSTWPLICKVLQIFISFGVLVRLRSSKCILLQFSLIVC